MVQKLNYFDLIIRQLVHAYNIIRLFLFNYSAVQREEKNLASKPGLKY